MWRCSRTVPPWCGEGAARQRQGLEDAERSQRRNETRVADLLPPSDTGDSALRIAGIRVTNGKKNTCKARVGPMDR